MANLPRVALTPGSTSYYSDPEQGLDPRLFDGDQMHPEVRAELMTSYREHMTKHYHRPEAWSHVWLAGSGASHQWSADRNPGDLDMLVGVDYPEFRYHNQQYSGLTDTEISWMLNQRMRDELSSGMTNWHGTHEVTWYNNPESADIRKLNPYAAYSLTENTWHVRPEADPARATSPFSDADALRARTILSRYSKARTALSRRDVGGDLRNSHARALNDALSQGAALFNEIHNGRRAAFLPGGLGYSDPTNARWQAGKATGVVPAMRTLAKMYEEQLSNEQISRYGMTFPDPSELITRAMILIAEDER